MYVMYWPINNSLCINFFHLLAWKPNLENFQFFQTNSFIILTCPNIQFNLSLASGKWVSAKTAITCVTSVQNTSDLEYAIKWPTYEIFFNICFCHSFISIFNQTFSSQSNVTTSLQSKVHLNNKIYQVIEN